MVLSWPKITSFRISTKSGCIVMRRPDDRAKPSGGVAHFAKLRISTQILRTGVRKWMKSMQEPTKRIKKIEK